MARILRGGIYWADLNPVVGREQAGKRPVVVLSQAGDAEERFAKLKGKGGKEQYLKLPAPSEDVVDCVERLIGLPPPPNGSEGQELAFPERATAGVTSDREVVELRRELETA